MAAFCEAPEEVVDLVNGLIGSNPFHENLEQARIGILMRDEAPETNGVVTMAKSRKVTDEQKVYIPYDFIIWFAQDSWDSLTATQQSALVEHELCHLFFGDHAGIRPHDIEEFNYIIEKYGFWRPYTGQTTQLAVQRRFEFAKPKTVVSTFNPSASKDVLEQVRQI